MSKLTEIFEFKAIEVAQAMAHLPLPELIAQARDVSPPRGFRQALMGSPHTVGLIAEVKKASPSQGLIRAEFNPVEVAHAYGRAGADCLSVLTDEKFFQGSAENLRLVRAATHLPIIRKDFIFDRYQLWEARAWGADAILLIVAGIAKNALSELHHEASTAGLDVLVEVHNEDEAEIALELGADLVGINNRNLATFETDLDVTDRLMPMFDDQVVRVSESALTSLSEIERVRQAGARAVLIGTTFCQSPNIEEKVREVMGW